MTYSQKLISFHITDSDGKQNFLTWSYPSLTDVQKKFILDNFSNGYPCLRKSNIWFYFTQHVIKKKTVTITLLTKEFEPKKYKLLCDILGKTYSTCQNPVELVKQYLNVFTLGSCSIQENGRTFSCDLKNMKSSINIKDLIRYFDLEIILIYTAILLKRRIVVFNSNCNLLLNELFSIMNLIPSRNVEEYLYPLTDNLQKLKGFSFYVAGTDNNSLIKETHLYDLFVNMESREITVSPKAEDIMKMTKIHKDIALFLVKMSTSEMSETEVQRSIENKTNDLLNMLKNIPTVTTENKKKMITMTDLKTRNYQPGVENFLFNLALAENMMIL